MAENENGNPAVGADTPVGADSAPAAGVIGQYVKDLSFENPNAAVALQQLAEQQPQIDINVNVNGTKLNDEVYEVALKISATATYGENKAFVVELVYAGLFGLRNVPEDQLEPFMLITAPQLLFPFARRVIADATRDGGYPPLMLEPINFQVLYQNQKQQAAEATEAASGAPTTETVN